jgi:hypothetical protein
LPGFPAGFLAMFFAVQSIYQAFHLSGFPHIMHA